jgi:starch synthase (maltosyl-transferring)
MSKRGSVLIYNFFPRLVGPMSKWHDHFKRAKKMGFNWLYINPIQYSGFSGSLYSIKDYYKINPLFLDKKMSEDNQVRNMIHKAHLSGLKVMFDLVINHTALDSVLIEKHPDWYKKDGNGKIKNPQVWEGDKLVCTWGDLAEIDNEKSLDKENLWKYWLKLIKHFIKLGVDGFRCDAAYQVPTELWQYLIGNIHDENKKICFFAETLGCTIEEVIALAKSGFEYNFNSSKWWDFKEDWCLKQYKENALVSSSISFPESHDTSRLAKDLKLNIPALKMRYLFSALFSTGLMMPIGFEYGFEKKLDVVKTMPEDWEDTDIDLVEYITNVNSLKKKYKVLKEDSDIQHIEIDNPKIFIMLKFSKDKKEKVLIIINTDKNHSQHLSINIASILECTVKQIEDISLDKKNGKLSQNLNSQMESSQVIILYCANQ